MAPVSAEAIRGAKSRDALLFPGPNEGDVVERSLQGKTKVQLQDMCTEYKLPRTAPNKTTLEDRLKGYSERFCAEPEACRLGLTQSGARRSHKGRQDQATHSKVKLSDARRANLINTSTTERSKDLRTEHDKTDMLAWAARTTERLPYKPLQAINASKPVPQPHSTAIPAQSTTNAAIDHRLRNIEDRLDVLITSGLGSSHTAYAPADLEYASTRTQGFAPSEDWMMTDAVNSSFIDPTLWDEDSASTAMAASTSPLAPSFTTNAHAPEQPPPAVPAAHVNIQSAETIRDRHLVLGNGTVFLVTAADINNLNISAISFANDIASLDAMWDDKSASWRHFSPIIIRGQPIALTYWRDLFASTGLWPAHKSAWNEWKFLVDRYRLGTADEFWAAYTKNGKRMTFSAILKCLRQERKQRDKEIAERARIEYGDGFSSMFNYYNSRTGSRDVMRKDSAIAKEYMKLRGVPYLE